MTALLEIADLRIQLPSSSRAVLLDGVSLTVDRGETLSLVGESGSGKSLTVRSVLGLLPERAKIAGEVLFEGRSIFGMSAEELRTVRRQDVAMIFQDPRASINPVRSIGDYLVEGLRTSRGLSKGEAAIEAEGWLRAVGLSSPAERLNQFPHEISGGMLQRVMIASAIGSGARLLLADEPTTALDVSIQAEIMGVLTQLQQSLGLAVVFVTHDIDLAIATSNRIDVMYAGRIVESRRAEDLHDAPWHPYSAALIGSRPLVSRRSTALRAIGGQPATADDSQGSCAFAPRCLYAIASCCDSAPEITAGSGGYVRCFRSGELRAELALAVDVPSEDLTEPESGRVVVEVRNLRKTFKMGRQGGVTVAVDDVSFTVDSGECLGIVGESGSGKTTLARLLLGIETPDSGSVMISGQPRGARPRSATQRRHWAAQLQVVFQDPYTSLDPRQTPTAAVDEILTVNSPGQSREWRTAQVDRLLASVGLEGAMRTALPSELSGGQRQRVAIAKALAASPQAIILDEAVSGLDVSIQAQVLNLLAELQRETQVTYLFISHDLAVIRQVAHRVIVMKDGKIVERGLTSRVLDSPQHDYTQRLVEAAPRPGWQPPQALGQA
ncbi:MAG: ABC transporter ATP-binding protein [Actinobacteria bacterium]|nr:ABC transporter ATP-binding protein [Actinomycetota bacterium]